MQVKFSRQFTKQYAKAGVRMQKQFNHRLAVFQKDPFAKLLNNHALTGKYRCFRSINVTGDWRAIYSITKEGVCIFEVLGTHSQLYR
jgi:addiction module RelE/StbE family toxin